MLDCVLDGREETGSCDEDIEDSDGCCDSDWYCGPVPCCAEKRRLSVCSVHVNVKSDATGKDGIRCTEFSSGRLSRYRFRVREEKREDVWI